MNLRVNTTLATAVSLILFAGCASAANIVYNGDFEGGTYVGPNGDIVPNGWTDGPPYPTSLSNLNVENTVNSDQGPESGTNYVAYMSTAPSGKDCLYQDLTTVAGQQYDLSFWVAFTATAGSEIKKEMNSTDREPLPSHSRINGLTAMMGMVCSNTTYGKKQRRMSTDTAKNRPSAMPTMALATRPPTASAAVTRSAANKSAARTGISFAICMGLGTR